MHFFHTLIENDHVTLYFAALLEWRQQPSETVRMQSLF